MGFPGVHSPTFGSGDGDDAEGSHRGALLHLIILVLSCGVCSGIKCRDMAISSAAPTV